MFPLYRKVHSYKLNILRFQSVFICVVIKLNYKCSSLLSICSQITKSEVNFTTNHITILTSHANYGKEICTQHQ